MTTKDLSSFFGKSERTIKRLSDKAGIVFKNGILKVFDKQEVELISRIIYKKVPEAIKTSIDNAFNKPMTNDIAIPMTNVKAEYITKQDLIDYSKTLVKDIFKELLPLIKNNNQIEFKQDYYTLKAYCIKNKVNNITTSGLKLLGKEAVKISNDLNIEIHKADDEQWGVVNSYHIDVLKKLFEV